MRLVGLEISGFRAFAGSARFDLDADAVIIVGSNGCGKTSLFDAVLWALTGGIPRLGGRDAPATSLFSFSGEARVALDIVDTAARRTHIVRRFDGNQHHLLMESEDQSFKDQAAEIKLLELIWPPGLLAHDGTDALSNAITRSVYLQQDVVRQFLEADTDQDRFDAVSELVGAGRLGELQRTLESAKISWTRAMNVRRQDLEPIQRSLGTLEAELSRIGEPTADRALTNDWSEWWSKASSLDGELAQPRLEAAEASTTLDGALRRLDALRRQLVRRMNLATELQQMLGQEVQQTRVDVADVEGGLAELDQEIAALENQLGDARKRAAAEQQALTRRRQSEDEFRSLAMLALRHLTDTCPVCSQRYDVAETRRRLEARLSGGSEPISEVADDIPDLQNRISILAEQRESTQRDLRHAARAEQQSAEREAAIKDLADQLGVVPTESPKDQLNVLIDRIQSDSQLISDLDEGGNALALRLARVGSQARRQEMEHEISALRNQVNDLGSDIESTKETGRVAGRIIDGIRSASSSAIAAQVEQIDPLLKRIYTRIDPHPAFRDVRLLTTFTRGRGRLIAEVSDLQADRRSKTPALILSSSQVNALAVAVFLALNLGIPNPPLATAMMDDPLQSLDDVNLLGLVDLLRRVAKRRQLIISTHDQRFGDLLERKLRPVDSGMRTVVIEFKSWSRDGPSTSVRDVEDDTRPLRLVS